MTIWYIYVLKTEATHKESFTTWKLKAIVFYGTSNITSQSLTHLTKWFDAQEYGWYKQAVLLCHVNTSDSLASPQMELLLNALLISQRQATHSNIKLYGVCVIINEQYAGVYHERHSWAEWHLNIDYVQKDLACCKCLNQGQI